MLAVIPAKSISTRLKNKNIKILNNKPLIYYSIYAAIKSKLVTRVIVSTDSRVIANICTSFGAEAPFLRPKSYSKKNTSIKDVCLHAIKFLEKKEKTKIPEILILQPTSPLRTSIDIDKAIKLYKKNKNLDYLTSLTKTKPLEWMFYKNSKEKFTQISDKKIKNSQYLKQNYILNGAIYIMKRNIVFGKKINFRNISGIEIPYQRSIDIDNINDFKLAENFLKKNK